MDIPINALGWLIAGIMGLIVGAKSYRKFLQTNSLPSRYLGLFLLTLGTGLFFVGFPPLVTDSLTVINVSYLVGQLLLYASFYFEAQNLWLFVFNARFNKWWLLAPFTIAITMASVIELGGESVRFIENGQIIDWRSPQLALAIEAGLVLATFWPVGIAFVLDSRRTSIVRQKVKFIAMGAVSIIAGTFVAYINIFEQGVETVAQSWLNIILFSIIIVATLLPSKNKSRITQ